MKNYLLGALTIVAFYFACGGAGNGPVITSPPPCTTCDVNVPVLSFSPVQVFAQSSGSSVPGSYAGFCSTVWAGATTVVYGLGRWTDPNCGQNAFSVSDDGAPVIGSGTLEGLYAYGKGGVGDNDGEVRVFVSGVATGLTCNLGTLGNCRDNAHSYPVADGDEITVTITSAIGSGLRNVRVVVGKR